MPFHSQGVYLPDKLNLLLRHMARPLWASARRWLDPGYVARLEARLAGVANTEVDGDDKQLVGGANRGGRNAAG
jgi:hypothetical protein